jgi:CheY-like chemotaxis protein
VASNLDKIYSSGVTLLNIINDLLDISKIESGKLELISVEYDIPSLINDTAVLNSVRIGSKPIEFTIDADENLPCKFFGDELRVKQMLNNLLSNAFKYTQKGRVTWSITGKRQGDEFIIIFKVIDTGQGIRKEDTAALFQEYHQLDSKANRKIEGTGLGLALVKRMAELMGGTVSVESEYGKGSTFTLQILQKPLTDEPIGKDVAYSLSNMQFSQSKLARNSRLVRVKLPYARVLVVDDVLTNLDVARGMMKPYEMRVDCVTSGQQAIEAIQGENVRYNAVFMDHMMPGMDGIESADAIRALNTEYARKIPIIALTANAIQGTEKIFYQHGFQAFISKPIDIMELDSVIKKWVRDETKEDSPV